MYKIYKTKYVNNRLCLVVVSDEYPGEVYGYLTTNLEDNKRLKDNQTYLDINNSKELFPLLNDRYKTIGYQQSGFVTYPLVELDEDYIKGLEDWK